MRKQENYGGCKLKKIQSNINIGDYKLCSCGGKIIYNFTTDRWECNSCSFLAKDEPENYEDIEVVK
jgi:hypothetical protein